MINRNESQLLAKEQSNRLARAGTAVPLTRQEMRQEMRQSARDLPHRLSAKRQSASEPLAAPGKDRQR